MATIVLPHNKGGFNTAGFSSCTYKKTTDENVGIYPWMVIVVKYKKPQDIFYCETEEIAKDVQKAILDAVANVPVAVSSGVFRGGTKLPTRTKL